MAEQSEGVAPVKNSQRKADNATVAQRVEEVLRIRLDGAEFHDIVQYASEKQWGVSERQLWNYIHKADDLLVERQERNRKRTIARHISQRQALYARAVNAADYRTALAILADLAKLRGIYPAREIKELKQLAAAQGSRLEELERRLRDAGLPTQATPGACSRLTIEDAKRIAREAFAEAQAANINPGPILPPPDMDDSPVEAQLAD